MTGMAATLRASGIIPHIDFLGHPDVSVHMSNPETLQTLPNLHPQKSNHRTLPPKDDDFCQYLYFHLGALFVLNPLL